MDDNSSNDRCYLLELPRELRDMIIEEAIEVKEVTPYLGALVLRNIFQPPLAAVNRQLRAETLPLYYKTSHFSCASLAEPGQWERVQRWLAATQPYLHMIKTITFELCYSHKRVLKIKSVPGKETELRCGGIYPRSLRYLRESRDPTLDQEMRDIALELYHMERARNKCRFDKTKKRVKNELFAIRDGVGMDGFGLQEYLRTTELFWFPEEKRCREDIPELDSDFELD